jgi:hypothetical protein
MDPWRIIVAMLCCANHPPALPWPADATHVYVAAEPDNEPDLILPPEPPAPPQMQPGDEQILDFLTCSAGVSIRSAAAALGVHRERVRRAVERLRELGRIEFDGDDGWLAR